MKVSQRLAGDFAAEGVSAVFGMMGSGNMAWLVELTRLGVRNFEVRHEGAGCGMADGWARAPGCVDPREVCLAIDEIVPADIPLLAGSSGTSTGFMTMLCHRRRSLVAHSRDFRSCDTHRVNDNIFDGENKWKAVDDLASRHR